MFTRWVEARQLAADLLVHFSKGTDAANRAVMADTDEASSAFAREAGEEAQAVDAGLDRLEALLRDLHYSDELGLTAELRKEFAKYRALDHEILGLAVENTNLKAQRLCFGPAAEAADALRDALAWATSHVPARESDWHARALATSALLAVREIQVLQAPHIAAADDATMTELEKQMATLEASARSALRDLAGTSGPERRASIDAANAALDRFMGIHAQVIALSRRNSNVRSLALSLGQKRDLAAECESTLRALADRLAQHEFTGTR